MIKIFKGNIVIGDPAYMDLDNLKDNIVMETGFGDGVGTVHWAPDSAVDLKHYRKSLKKKSLDQELGDFFIDSGFLGIGLWKKKSKPIDEGLVYLTNYEGPVEIWQDDNEVSHVLGYGNIRFYSQWKNI